MLLFVFSRIFSPPLGFTTIPPSSDCRIFRSALSQKNCGACAAFAVSTFVSMHSCLGDRKDFIPSPYRVFDCANGTCDSGITFGRAMSVTNFGVGDVEDSVPEFGQPCDLQWEHRQKSTPRITYSILNDPLEIKTALVFFGPLLGSMTHMIHRDPSTRAYHLLPNFTMVEVDHLHAVVVVGWDAADHWIVQNSWGDHWGDEFGRGRIAQGALVFVFDPSARMTLWICFAVYCVASLALVQKTPSKHQASCAAMTSVVSVWVLVVVLRSSRQIH
jgi:hypothetical protein